MAKYQDIIELNGKIYNLKDSNNQLKKVATNKSSIKPNKLSDFVSPKPQTIIKPVVQSKPTASIKPFKFRESGTNTSRHQLQKSTILMRRSVSKPSKDQKNVEVKKTYSQSSNHIRNSRASQTKQSPYIRKFSALSKPLTTKIKPVAVAPLPQKTHNTKLPSQTIQNNSQLSKSDQLVANALSKISTNQPVKIKKPKKLLKLKWGSATLALLIIVGIFAYLNLALLSLKLASNKAGFSASMPKYKPDGYSLIDPISQQAGKISLGFKSNTDNRSYTVNQEVSNWNSQTLLENIITNHNLAFTATQDKGLTIYLYGNGKATWVNGGIWYQIESNGLSNAQLSNIATSM